MQNNNINIFKREYQEIFPCKFLTSQWWAYIAISLIWAPAILSPFIGGVRAFWGDSVKEIFMILVYSIPLVFGLEYIISKQKVSYIIFYICCTIVYLSNNVFFPANSTYLEQYMIKTLLQVLPMIFVGSFLQKENIWKLLFYCSVFSVVWNYYYYAKIVVADDYAGTAEFIAENMTKSYANLPHVLMVLWQTLRRPQIWKIVPSVLGILMVFGFGTRGPLLCTGVFIATYLFFFKSFKHAILSRGLIVASLSLFLMFIEPIFELVGGYVEQMGLSTRIFDFFTGSGLDDANGRNYLKYALRPYMDMVPFFGYGIWGTFPIIKTYPHDLIWDMILTFGLIGVLFLILFAILVFVAIRQSPNSIQREFICVLICGPAVLKLMLSGSFLMEPYFFLLLGYCTSVISLNKKNIIDKK